jgi:hypothetical protein
MYCSGRQDQMKSELKTDMYMCKNYQTTRPMHSTIEIYHLESKNRNSQNVLNMPNVYEITMNRFISSFEDVYRWKCQWRVKIRPRVDNRSLWLIPKYTEICRIIPKYAECLRYYHNDPYYHFISGCIHMKVSKNYKVLQYVSNWSIVF